jgi:hypothetical protein
MTDAKLLEDANEICSVLELEGLNIPRLIRVAQETIRGERVKLSEDEARLVHSLKRCIRERQQKDRFVSTYVIGMRVISGPRYSDGCDQDGTRVIYALTFPMRPYQGCAHRFCDCSLIAVVRKA